MITFLKGDTTAAITLALADGFDYSGKTVNLEYQGVRRTFTGCVAGGALTFAFAAEETAPMSLGAYPVRVWIEGGGEVLTVHNADVRLRVTDCIADVHGGGAIYLDVHGGLHGIEGLPERFTEEDLRSKVNEILRRLGGAVAMAVLALLPAFGSTVDVLTAPKGVIYNDQQVVTNVTVDVSDKADKTDTYTKDETDARIVELSPPTDLTPATNYTDKATNETLRAALAAITNGTDEVSAWKVYANGAVRDDFVVTTTYGDTTATQTEHMLTIAKSETTGDGLVVYAVSTLIGEVPEWPDDITYTLQYEMWFDDLSEGDVVRVVRTRTRRSAWGFATTNDLQSVSRGVSETTATNIAEAVVREKSLGGIWDGEVWWTPVMLPGGCLTYQATTNVNMEANQ